MSFRLLREWAEEDPGEVWRSADSFVRSYALDDIGIRRSGDGRTVEAYAAIFGSPYEVRDQHGHYYEEIHRGAFDKHLSGGEKPICVYNHGMSLSGRPDAIAAVPLGTPLEIRPDGRGLLTVTRYNKTALAESVLEAIRHGDIRSQSFRGHIHRSSPDRVPRSTGGSLPTITRLELGLSDYGPTPIPVNHGAEILAVRGGYVEDEPEETRWWQGDAPPRPTMASLGRKIRMWERANGLPCVVPPVRYPERWD